MLVAWCFFFPLLASQHCSNDRRFKAYTTLSNTENKYEPQKHVNASISVVSLLCFLVSTNVSQPSMELSNHIFSWEKKEQWKQLMSTIMQLNQKQKPVTVCKIINNTILTTKKLLLTFESQDLYEGHILFWSRIYQKVQ